MSQIVQVRDRFVETPGSSHLALRPPLFETLADLALLALLAGLVIPASSEIVRKVLLVHVVILIAVGIAIILAVALGTHQSGRSVPQVQRHGLVQAIHDRGLCLLYT